ncbi:MAG: PEP-CTERM sorting domain-containing protein [Rubrivivax sp.]
MKKLLMLSLLAAAGGSQAIELYSNGPVVGTGGISILTAPNTSYGAGSTATQLIADSFAFTGASWKVSSLDFFAYQTAAVGFTFTTATWAIRSGTDINSSSIVASGTTPVTNGGLEGYRVLSTALTLQNRAIYRINADIPDITLAAGSYFVTWGLAGTSTSGPFVPPVQGTLGSGNAQFSSTGGAAWNPLTDGGSLLSYDVPFAVQGTVVVVPEPATVGLMLVGGLAVVGLARRRRQAAA